jgi:tRNA threonylcarbamoyl adenosine modification protein (Sua5/YciO/YrdC/YwlC family)
MLLTNINDVYFNYQMLIPLHPQNPNFRDIKKIADILQGDGIVIIPTDTIYAMACKLSSKKGIERMAKIAGKKVEKVNFSLICSDLSHLSDYTSILNKSVFRLLKNNLPGPFTFILKANNNVTRYFSSNKKTIGIRVPNNIVAQAVVCQIEQPLVVSTIHHSDEIVAYMTDPEEIYETFKHRVDAVIDAGAGGNEPSTIIDCVDDEPFIVREGKGILAE